MSQELCLASPNGDIDFEFLASIITPWLSWTQNALSILTAKVRMRQQERLYTQRGHFEGEANSMTKFTFAFSVSNQLSKLYPRKQFHIASLPN